MAGIAVSPGVPFDVQETVGKVLELLDELGVDQPHWNELTSHEEAVEFARKVTREAPGDRPCPPARTAVDFIAGMTDDFFLATAKALLLPAGLNRQAASAVVERFGGLRPSCAVLSKVDDGARPGELVAALAPSRIPLAFLTNGHRVPEDLQPASPRSLAVSP